MGVKEVVEEVSGWLKVYSDGSVEREWSGAEEVKALITPVPSSPSSFVDGVATRDIVLNNQTGVWLRIYLPDTAHMTVGQSKLPLLLHFPGGGFCVSHADWRMYYQFYARLVKASNVICVSVDCRLAPEHRLPAAIDDCLEALLWLRSVASGKAEEAWLAEYADFSRCILVGDSSGGNLVHQVAVRAGEENMHPLCVKGGVCLHPGFVRAERSKSESQKSNESPLLTLDMVDKFLSLALPLGSTKDHPITSPMGPQAPPLAGLKLPRMLVAIAERDLIRDTEIEYCQAMKSAGHHVEEVISENMGHSFHLNEIAVKFDPHTAHQTSKLLDAIDRFINSC
eukprot:Gb_02816 [translate_table: standard]